MAHAHHMIRLSLDIPIEMHAYLKMLAAKRGISMRQFIMESIGENIEQEAKHIDLSENKFKKALKKVLNDNDDVLERLANK